MGKIYKALIFDNEISLTLLDTTDIVNTAIKYHNLSPVCSAALGRSLTATCFMASNLKNEGDHLSVVIDGNGLGGAIVVCADKDLNVRGYITNPNVEIPLNSVGKLDVSSCVGNQGSITVVKNLGLKTPYTGTAKIVSGEIAEDFAHYFTLSEQVPTAMALGVRVGKDLTCVGAGGIVLQVLPGAKDENISKAEELISHFYNISSMIEEMGVNGIIDAYFNEILFDIYETQYKCNCTKERVDKVLITLGKEELLKMVEEQGKIEINCHFCPSVTTYYKKDIEELF